MVTGRSSLAVLVTSVIGTDGLLPTPGVTPTAPPTPVVNKVPVPSSIIVATPKLDAVFNVLGVVATKRNVFAPS